MPVNNRLAAVLRNMGRGGGSGGSGGGVQPDMAQNDPTKADYVKNRTHYDSRRTSEIKITFDGNLEGKELFAATEERAFVKVSDYVPSEEEFLGGRVVEKWESGTNIYEGEDLFAETIDDGVFMFSDAVWVSQGGTQNVPLPKGTWFIWKNDDAGLHYPTELSYTGTTGELKKLDAKYLPEDLVIDYSTNTPSIVSGSVDAVLQKLAAHQKTHITIFREYADPDMVYFQYAVTGVSGYKDSEGYGRLNIHFMYFNYSNHFAEERIFVFSADGVHEDTIGGASEAPA